MALSVRGTEEVVRVWALAWLVSIRKASALS